MYASLLNHPGNLFGQFEQLRRELDNVFGSGTLPSAIRSVPTGTLPALNVGRTASTVEVYVFVPGIDPSKIDVDLDRGVLRISGERMPAIPQNDPSVQVYARERRSGKLSRSVSLPDDIDPSKVTATYRDGVLQVSIARREAPQPTRIAIQ